MNHRGCYIVPATRTTGEEFNCQLCDVRIFKNQENNEGYYHNSIQKHCINPEHLARVETEKLNVLISIYNKINESGLMKLR